MGSLVSTTAEPTTTLVWSNNRFVAVVGDRVW